jgi:hypothetical protein
LQTRRSKTILGYCMGETFVISSLDFFIRLWPDLCVIYCLWSKHLKKRCLHVTTYCNMVRWFQTVYVLYPCLSVLMQANRYTYIFFIFFKHGWWKFAVDCNSPWLILHKGSFYFQIKIIFSRKTFFGFY